MTKFNSTECILWGGGRDGKGYGVYYTDSRSIGAHRQAWENKFGPIPVGKVIMHLCNNPPCVNTDHLKIGTIAENNAYCKSLDRQAKGIEIRQSKLTEMEVVEIRIAYAKNQLSALQLAKKYNVAKRTIHRIVNFETWKHI